MTYQDIWGGGKLIQRGKRPCNERYDIIKNFCNRFNKSFSVLDIGANMCYFGIRLTEDFEQSNIMAFEFNSFEMRNKHVKKYGGDRLLFLKRKLSLSDINSMSVYMCFDLILALSVLHHVVEPVINWIEALRNLGNNLIIEFAIEDSKRIKATSDNLTNLDYDLLGYGDSHLSDVISRPIILIK